jgi:tetratricopeptide (TPR) repeat protein
MNDTPKSLHILLENISKYVPVALAFIMPLFFLPTATEFFEFNKLALLTGATLLLIVLWAVKILAGQKVEFTKSVVDLPLMALTLVFALATVFSIHKTTSIYGSQGRWFPSLFGFLVLLGYFFFSTPAVKDFKTIKISLLALAASSGLSSLISIMSYFNIFLGSSDYFRIQNFTVTGSVTTAIFLAAIGALLAVSLLAYEKAVPTKIVLGATVAVNFFFLGLINSFVGWVILGTGLLALVFFIDSGKFVENRLSFMMLSGVLAALLMIVFLPSTRDILINKNYPSEMNLPLRESWIISSSTIQDYPILATGPSTFSLNFSRYRPLTLNTGNNWNVRYDKPYNELLDILGTIGIVGLIAAIYFGSKLLKLISGTRSLKDETGLTKVVAIALFATSVAFLFTYATVLTAFIFFGLLSFLIAGHTLTDDQNRMSEKVTFNLGAFSSVSSIGIGEMSVVKREYFRYILAVPIFLLVGYAGYLGFKNYQGEYFMRMAIVAAKTNDAAKIYEYQRMAISANPTRDAYQSAYARTNLVLANALAAKGNLSDNDKQTVQGLIAQAIQSARVVTEVVSPLNVANWETRALVYSSIMGVAQNASDWAISSYNTAIQYDPTNPKLRLDLGGIYFAKGDYLTAANLFRQATALKADYANAHYNFAQSLLKLNDIQSALTELQATKNLVPVDSADYKQVDAEIAALQAQQPVVAGAATEQKPTVEQLSGNNPAQNTTQEPLAPADKTQGTTGDKLNPQVLPQPTATPTPKPSATPKATVTPTPSPTPTVTATPTPAANQ